MLNKGKEIVAARKGFKRLRKGTKGSSSSTKGAPARILIDYHGSMHKRRSNMLLRIGLMKDTSHLSSPPFET
ncbi:hypothetical protein HAX54_036254, partial [Datura stramonium]|nr:hypothetical protein [Datura stramonium]